MIVEIHNNNNILLQKDAEYNNSRFSRKNLIFQAKNIGYYLLWMIGYRNPKFTKIILRDDLIRLKLFDLKTNKFNIDELQYLADNFKGPFNIFGVSGPIIFGANTSLDPSNLTLIIHVAYPSDFLKVKLIL